MWASWRFRVVGCLGFHAWYTVRMGFISQLPVPVTGLYIRVIIGIYIGNVGIMEKKMETTIIGLKSHSSL